LQKKTFAFIITVFVCALLVVTPSPAKAQFVVATISDLDEYGQGISPGGIDILENSTGSWIYAQPFGGVPSPFNWTAGLFMQVRLETRLNATLTGASDLTDGKNYLKHSITVSNYSATVFSQQNFTYRSSADVSGIYYYSYEVILNFSPLSGTIYTIAITYEVYW